MGNPVGDSLVELGLRLPELIAGFAGGVVSALVVPQSSPVKLVSSVLVGALTANYLGAPAAAYLGFTSPGALGSAAFIVGLGGMAICQGIVEAIKRWRPTVPGGTNGSTGN